MAKREKCERENERTDRERKRKKRNSGSASRTRERIGHQARKERGVEGQGGKRGRHVMGKIKSGQLCMCEGWSPRAVGRYSKSARQRVIKSDISADIQTHTRFLADSIAPERAGQIGGADET